MIILLINIIFGLIFFLLIYRYTNVIQCFGGIIIVLIFTQIPFFNLFLFFIFLNEKLNNYMKSTKYIKKQQLKAKKDKEKYLKYYNFLNKNI